MYETIRVALAGTLREKSPSRLVIVPLEVFPFSTMEAPIIGSPVASFTLPVAVIVCADTLSEKTANIISSKTRMFFILLDIIFLLIYRLLIL